MSTNRVQLISHDYNVQLLSFNYCEHNNNNNNDNNYGNADNVYSYEHKETDDNDDDDNNNTSRFLLCDSYLHDARNFMNILIIFVTYDEKNNSTSILAILSQAMCTK